MLILSLFFLCFTGNMYAQESNLSKAVKDIKSALIKSYVESREEKIEKGDLPILLDGKPMNYEILDKYSLSDVKQITISFEKKIILLYGDHGKYGVIQISLKEKDPK